MQYSTACGEKISKLAFGTMRLPLKDDGSIDQNQVNEMTDYTMGPLSRPRRKKFIVNSY